MKLNRRSFVQSGTVAAALSAFPARAELKGESLFVFDSRVPRSVAAASRIAGPRLDVAAMDAENWKRLRGQLPSGQIAGLTRWSDLVLVRGYAEEQGKRLKAERRQGQLFEWKMS